MSVCYREYNKRYMDARRTPKLLLIACLLWLAACNAPASAAPPAAVITQTAPAGAAATAPLPTASPAPTATPAPVDLIMADSVPPGMKAALILPANIRVADKKSADGLTLDVLPSGASGATAEWVYALVAPFPTIPDSVSLAEIRAAWQGRPGMLFKTAPLLLSASTLAAFESAWGPVVGERVKVVDAGQLLDAAWSSLPSWALIPFEELSPRWKVLRIANISPLDRDFDRRAYPLTLRFGLTGAGLEPAAQNLLPATNRDPQKLTVLVMTGTTALTRQTAEKMEEQGVTYPARDIGALLRSADLTHISNEVSFYADCPAPARRPPNFCSAPGYIALLDTVGADIIELTGNHLMDWGAQPFVDTLSLYRQKNWLVYGGGATSAQAQQPLTLTDHGNKLAFVGCNASGPASDWATDKTPGSAPCDFDHLTRAVQDLVRQGYLVIATFQHVEVCQMEPHLAQQADFGKLVKAGAVIVSGSQAHCPQGMAFTGQQFVHYGLGNLFFDQMDDFSRRQFIDRHVFYDGRYISTELVTTMLEDYARPRLMTAAERQKLLEDAFRASGWIQ